MKKRSVRKKRSIRKKRSFRKKKSDGNKKEEFIVVSLKGCGSCMAAKELIKKKGHTYKEVEYDMNNNVSKNEWNQYIKNVFNKEHKTFPKIFHKKKFIGGYNDLQERI